MWRKKSLPAICSEPIESIYVLERLNMCLEEEAKISIIIPCYNCEGTIYRAVQSVMLSERLPYEVLLYDDCSVDGTRNVLQLISEEFNLVKIFLGDLNRGAGYARRFLIENSSGDYIAFLDSDDRWLPHKIDKILEIIHEKDPDIITSSYDIEDETGSKFGTRILPQNIGVFKMHFSNWLPMSMTVVRKRLVGVDQMPLIRRRQDYAFWLNIFKRNSNLKCHVIKEPLGVYTRRKNGLSSNVFENVKFNYEMFREIIGYNPVVAAFLVFCNSLIRVFRV